MAPVKLSELRTTQETQGGSTTATLSDAPAERFHCDQGPTLHVLKEDNVRSRVPAKASERLPPHVLNSLAHPFYATLPHAGAPKGSAHSSTKSSDALHEARHHQQAAENSDLVSTFLQALTESAPRPQHSSRRVLHVSYSATDHYVQKNDTDVSPPESEPPRVIFVPTDPLSLASPLSRKLLPSDLAPASTGGAVSESSALTAPTEACEEGTSSIGGARTSLETLRQPGNLVKPPTTVQGENLVAKSPQYANRLYDIWELPFLLSSRDNLGPPLNLGTTIRFPPAVECDRNTGVELATEEVHFSNGCLPGTSTSNRLDVHEMRETVVELEDTTPRNLRGTTKEELEPLLQVRPLASTLPAEVYSLPLDNWDKKQNCDQRGLGWDGGRAENEESKRIEVQSADIAEPPCLLEGNSQPAKDSAGSLIERKMCGVDFCAEKVSAFIAALHAFLASGHLYLDVDDQFSAESAAVKMAVLHHHDIKGGHHDFPVASPTGRRLSTPGVSPVPNSQGGRKPSFLGKDQKLERAVQITKSDDTAMPAVGSASDILGRPIYSSAACSDRTSCCSSTTALGSDISSYAGTSFDRSASYTSCSSFGTGGYSTAATIMLDRSSTLEHAEVEKVEAAACSSFYHPSLPVPATYVEDSTAALREKTCSVAMARASTVHETSRFQQLVRTFYADSGRHSILWPGDERCLLADASPGQGQLSAQRETWKPAAGIIEVTQQINGLVKRLRGLQLITQEMVSIPDVSRDVLCCCLSGDLLPNTTDLKVAATSTSAKWRFEQLLVLSVKADSSSKGMHGNKVEPPVARFDEMSSASVAALYDFQIQDEVLVIAPAQKLQASSTHTRTHMGLESLIQRPAPDTASDESSNSEANPMGSPPRAFHESTSRHLLERGWIALLEWQEQHRLREEGAVTSVAPPVKAYPLGNCKGMEQAAPEQASQWVCANIPVNTSGNEAEAIFNDRTKGNTSSIFLGQPVEYQSTWKANSSRPSEAGHHLPDALRTDNTTVATYIPVRSNEAERGSGKPMIEALSGHADVATGGVTFSVMRTTHVAGVPANGEVDHGTGVHCQEMVQLLSKQGVQKYAAPLLPGYQQLKQAATRRAPENLYPGSAAVTEVQEVSSNQLMTALLRCLQNIEMADVTPSHPKRERCFLPNVNPWEETTATHDSSRSLPSAPARPEGREVYLDHASREFSPGEEWHDGTSVQKDLFLFGTRNSRVPSKSSTYGKHGARKRYWGRESLEAGTWRESAFRPLSPKAQAERVQDCLEPNSEIVEQFQSMGFFREHCTVFISWVPRAARADNLKQKVPMEMRLKVLLQMAMGVRGIVRVALFPPRGSHCCVLFENPTAASAFIQDYGGPTYTSTTERFKADICAAYAVALDRGIERVFIRIEEFKPHILQQHLLQQAKDCGLPPLRPWQERRRDCAPTSHQFTGGKWRQPQSAPVRDRSQPTSATSVQPFPDSLSQHDIRTHRDTVSGQDSVSQPLWQLRDQGSEGYSTREPRLRPHAPQQLLENVPHRNHRLHRRNK